MIAPAYHRSLLSPAEQESYRKIVAGLLRNKMCIRIDQTQREVVRRIVNAVHLDHPELYAVEFWAYHMTLSPLIKGATLHFQLMEADVEPEAVMHALNAMAASLQRSVKRETSQEGIYLKIAKEIGSTTTYKDTGVPWRDHTVVGPAVFHTGVCEAVAKIYLFLCQRVNVPCAIITGTSNGVPHAWNMIELNGVRKYIDVTSVLQTISLYTLVPAALFKSEQALRRSGYD